MMNCPGCGEKIHKEELIDGSCPLCGVDVESEREGDTSKQDPISEIVELFEGAEAMAVNMEEQSVERSFVLHVSPSTADKLKPKKCGACGRWHVKFGDKEYQVSMEGGEGELERRYICRLCTSD